jgi:Cep192 domain 4
MSNFPPLARTVLVGISALLTSLAMLAPPGAARHGYAVAFRITPPVGAFGATPVGTCDLVTYEGCRIKTFTVTNVGSTTILFNGYGVEGTDPQNAALVFPQENGCGNDISPSGSFQLQPGASCLISVAFGPTHKGLNTNQLTIFYPDQFTPIAVVPLKGIGT